MQRRPWTNDHRHQVVWVVAFEVRRERASTAAVSDPPLEGARPLVVVQKRPDGLEGCLPNERPDSTPSAASSSHLARRLSGDGCDGRSAGGHLAAYLVCGLTHAASSSSSSTGKFSRSARDVAR